MEITAKLYPKKFDPVSPINVFAGLKLNGKNPVNAPANAVIRSIAIIGASLSENIINKDKQDIKEIPDDNPSNPSIKLIAFVIPTIQATVNIDEKASLNPIWLKNGIFICSIFIPLSTITIAAKI